MPAGLTVGRLAARGGHCPLWTVRGCAEGPYWMLSFPLDFVVIGMASFDAGALSLVRSLSRSTWLARLDGALVVARAVTDPPADEVEPSPLLVPILGTADLDGTTWLVRIPVSEFGPATPLKLMYWK